jgi:hypothetical protein
MKKVYTFIFACLLSLTAFSQYEYLIHNELNVKDTSAIQKPTDKFFDYNKNAYRSIALGFGQSYGGVGARFQGRLGKILGFGYHLGLGYSVNDMTGLPDGVLFAAGLKFFWHKAWYADFQFGPVQDYIVLDDNRMVIETGTAWGPAILVGGDWFFDKSFGMNGAIGRAWNITEPKAEKDELPRIELGLIFKF